MLVYVTDNLTGSKVAARLEDSNTIGELIESVADYFEREPGDYALFNKRTKEWLNFGDDPKEAAARGWRFDQSLPILGNQPAANYLKEDDELVFDSEPHA